MIYTLLSREQNNPLSRLWSTVHEQSLSAESSADGVLQYTWKKILWKEIYFYRHDEHHRNIIEICKIWGVIQTTPPSPQKEKIWGSKKLIRAERWAYIFSLPFSIPFKN